MSQKREMDLTVRLAGVRFQSPILVASSECGADLSFVKRLCQRPVAGIVTKTFTSRPEHKIRVRPYQFPLKHDRLYSLAAPHVEDLGPWLSKVQQMAGICKRGSVKLIASFFEDPDDLPLWVDRARAFEQAGASMLELNFSCPHVAKLFSQGPEGSGEIISGVKERVSIPVGVKICPTLEPLEPAICLWEEAGLDFITAHNAPSGLVIDVEREVPYGAPSFCGYAMGRAFLPYSLARVVRIQRAAQIPVIGVGGIGDPSDVLQYLLCGTPLAGVGSALYFHGPDLVERIHEGVCAWMEKKGYGSVSQFLGKALPLIRDPGALAREEPYPFVMPPHCPYVPIIREDRCTLCGLCEKTCIYGVFHREEEGSPMLVEGDRCWSCGFCVGVCPKGAIELRDRRDRERVIWNNQGMAASFS